MNRPPIGRIRQQLRHSQNAQQRAMDHETGAIGLLLVAVASGKLSAEDAVPLIQEYGRSLAQSPKAVYGATPAMLEAMDQAFERGFAIGRQERGEASSSLILPGSQRDLVTPQEVDLAALDLVGRRQ